MGNFRRISKKYYVRQIVACWLVFMLFGMPVQVALAVENPLPGALPSYTTLGVDYDIGAGSIGTIVPGLNSLTINSVANGTAIYIDNHDIGALGTVTYNQVPNGWVLVKINETLGSTFYGDGAPTGIAGMLIASDNFILMNKQGISSAPGSLIQARNFVGAAMRITDADFGNFANGTIDYLNFQGGDIGSVTNNGTIEAENIAALIGKSVTNKGTIRTTAPGGAVIMAAGESVYLSEVGSNVSVEVSQGYTRPYEHVVDNGGSNGTGTGTIDATGGKVILAAGDIYSTAIEGVESLRAEATGDITLNGAIGATGHVEILGGQNRIISRHAQININEDITAGSMRIKNGKDVEPGEESLSGIYVAEGKNLTATAGDVVVEAVHNVELGGNVSATGDVFINGDEDGYGDPKGNDYNPSPYGGGDVIANDITAGGNVDIKGNAIQLNGDVSAEGGDLTITGRTSKDNYTDFSESGLNVEWGYIDVAEGKKLYASDDVILKDAFGSGGDEPPILLGEMDLTGDGSLEIEAAGGSIQTQGPIGDGVKITVQNSSLTMKQADPLNLVDYSFGNQNNTDLTLTSYNGSVTAVDSSHTQTGKNANAADQWLSITATAYADIWLQGHDASRDITAGALTSNAADFDTGNITVTSDNRKVLLTEDVIANQGSIAITAIDPTNGGIESGGDILASDGITLFGEVTADASIDQTFDAGQGTLWAKDTLSTITKTGTGGLTLGGDTLVNLDGIDGSTGDSVWVQAGPLTIEDSLDAEGNLKALGIIHLQGTTNNVAGDILSTGSGIIIDHDLDADGVGSQVFDAGTGKLIAENEADIDKSTAGSLTLAGDTGIELGGNVTGTGMTSGDKLIFVNNVTADGTGDAEDQRFDAGLGALDADGSIAKTTDGKLNLGGDEGIELGGNVETHDGDLTFEDAVTANGGDQVFDAGTAYHSWGNDLVAEDDIIKTTDGSLTLDGGRGDTDSEIYLGGNVTTRNGNLTFKDKVVANGTNGTGDQIFDAGTSRYGWGNDLIAEQDIIKTTDGSLTLDGGRGDVDSEIYLAGDVKTTNGDLTFEDKVIANGSGSQRFDALGGKLWAQQSITKTTAGNLDMFGGYNGPLYPGMDYSVSTKAVTVDDGELSIAGNATVKLDGSIYSSGNMTLASNVDGIASTPSSPGAGSPEVPYDYLIHNSGTIQSRDGDVDLSGTFIALNGGDNPTDPYVLAGRNILLRNTTTVQESRKLQAVDDIVLAEGKRLQGQGSLTLVAGDDIIIGSTDVDNHWLDPEDDTGIPSEVRTKEDMILNAGDDVYVHGELNTLDGFGGDIEITASDDTIHLYGNVTADQTDGGDIILHANTEVADGVKLDAGDDIVLAADKQITGNGSLTLEAGDDILLGVSNVAQHWLNQGIGSGGDVSANGNLILTAGDDIHAHGQLSTDTDSAGYITAMAVDDIHLYNTPTSADADGTLTLTADSDDNKSGDLTVNGALYGNMGLSGYNVTVDGIVDSDGILGVDADNDIRLKANVSSVGEMTMVAGSDIELNRSSGNTSSESTISLNAGDDVTIGRVFSGEGNVTANGKMDIFAGSDSDDSVKVFGKLTTTNGGNIHVTAGDDIKLYGTFYGPDFESAQADGDLTLDAEDDVDVLGDLISNNGSIDIYSSDDTTYLGGDVYAAYDVTLHNNTILDGGDNQTLEAGLVGDGTMTAGGWLWKTTPGHLYLYGYNSDSDHRDGKAIDLQYAGCLPAASTTLGNLELYAEDGDIQISGDLTTFGPDYYEPSEMCIVDFEGSYDRPTGGVSVIAEYGKIYTDADSPDPAAGDYMLNIGIVGNSDHYQCLGVDLPWGEEGKAAIVVLSREDLIFGPDTMLIARGNYYDAGGKSIWDFIDFAGVTSYDDYFTLFDDLFEEQLGGCIAGQGAFCSAVMDFLGDLDDEGFDFGDPDAFKDLFTDFVGEYFADLLIVDDRPGVGFLADPLTSIGGIIRDEGDPIDVAIYVGSMGTEDGQGNVHLDGRAIDVAEAGTMVVDAYDTVTFGDFETFNLEDFDGCEDLGCFLIKLAMRFQDDIDFGDLCDAYQAYRDQYDWQDKTEKDLLEDFLNYYFDEGFFFNIGRLEVASRISEWLFEAVGRLPFANDPTGIAALEAFIGGDYILRGAGLGNPLITDGRAWVLVDPISPPPLFQEAGEAAEDQDIAEGGCPPLMNWLANEIGVPAEDIQVVVANTLALNTDIQPCEMCARLLDASKTLQDAEGTQIAAMAQVVNEFVTTTAPPSPEQMTQIAGALAEHVGDGTHYAAAGQWIDALVAYVGIMNTEMGYSAADSVAFAEKYLTPVTDVGNVTLTAYVTARLAALGG